MPRRRLTAVADDFVLVLLEDVFTTAERTLVACGHGDQVKATRAAFATALHDRFVAAVETATGRRVRAFSSQATVEPEMVAELFVLEPETG